MIKKILTFFLTLAVLTHANAQDAYRTHSIAIGAGWANVLDTYLSPFDYKGSNIRLSWNTERNVKTFGIKDIEFNTLLNADCSFIKSPAKNVDEYSGGARFAATWLKQLTIIKPGQTTMTLSAGPMLSAYLGAIYNERNGNNPAQAKADIMLDIAAKARWNFKCLKKDMSLQYILAVPLAGIAFSPDYGQSYYEAFGLNNYDHNVVFANFTNMPSARHAIYLDCQISKKSKNAIRIGYEGFFMQSKFNNIRYHAYTNSFMIGITKYFKRI